MDGVKATHNGLDSRRDFQFQCTTALDYLSFTRRRWLHDVRTAYMGFAYAHAWHDPHFRSLARQLTCGCGQQEER